MVDTVTELSLLVLNHPPKEATMIFYYGDLVSRKESMELCSHCTYFINEECSKDSLPIINGINIYCTKGKSKDGCKCHWRRYNAL